MDPNRTYKRDDAPDGAVTFYPVHQQGGGDMKDLAAVQRATGAVGAVREQPVRWGAGGVLVYGALASLLGIEPGTAETIGAMLADAGVDLLTSEPARWGLAGVALDMLRKARTDAQA